MSGSDLDGDVYFVCWEESLIPPGPNETPMDYTPKAKEFLSGQISEKDMITFLGRYMESDQLGVIANAHLVHADAQTKHIFSKQCLDLAQKHSDAVDFPKTGCLVVIPAELRPQSYPRYMHKRDKPIYRSNHVLAALYDQCKAIDSTIQISGHVPRRLDDAFLVAGHETYLDTARQLRDFYQAQLRELMANYGVVSEAEIISGHVHRIAQKQSGTIKKEYLDTVHLIRRHLESIKLQIRNMFYEEFGGENKQAEFREEAVKKVSAVYCVVYDSDEEVAIGLPWMFVDLLMSAWCWNNRGSGSVSESSELQASVGVETKTSLLDVLSEEIASFSNSYIADEEMRQSRERRREALEVLRSAVHERQITDVSFVCFGSTVTQYDHASSTLDVLVVYNEADINLLEAVELVNEVFDSSSLILKKSTSDGSKPFTVCIDKQEVVVHWSYECLKRTVKILAVTLANKWVIPVLRVILRWAREKNVSESRRNCLLTPEQLVLLFIAFAEKEMVQYCVQTTAEDDDKVSRMLLTNHFQDCDISQCRHLRTSQYEQKEKLTKADVLLRFLHHYYQQRGKLIKDARDVSMSGQDVKLVKLADPHYGRIAERMLQAYYTLASSGSLEELLHISVASSKEHRVIPLARQVASIVIFVEEYYEEKLRRSSGATSVKILRKRFRNTMAGLCLDVWGGQRSLILIEDSIRDLEQMSMLYVRSMATLEKQHIHGAYVSVLENSSGPSAQLVLEPYTSGIVQNSHERQQASGKLYVPRLLNPSPSEAYSLEKFISSVMRQVEFLNQSYDETLFGELGAVVSFGTCYVIAENQPPPDMSEEQFLERLTLGLPTTNENLVNPDRATRRTRAPRPGRGIRRSGTAGRAGYDSYSAMVESFPDLSLDRGRRVGGSQRGRSAGRSRASWSDDQRPPRNSARWRESYIPVREFHTERFHNFLSHNGFEFNEDYQIYLITIKLQMSGYQSNIDGVLVLDEDMRLKELTMTDTKWICVNIFTDKSNCATGAQRPVNDIRFRIHSRVSLSPLEMAKHQEDCADLIENHKHLLILDQRGHVIGVHKNYRSRIHYVRYKDVTVYQLAQNPQVSSMSECFVNKCYSLHVVCGSRTYELMNS